MKCVIFVGVLDTKVVNTEYKADGSGFVAPEAGCVGTFKASKITCIEGLQD